VKLVLDSSVVSPMLLTFMQNINDIMKRGTRWREEATDEATEEELEEEEEEA
jgi:predicted DNA-binding protein (UPF0278 family)